MSMKLVSSPARRDQRPYAKGIKILAEIWKKYKQRLPSKFYLERMLQIADFLFGKKLYQFAFWQGYSLHLLQFSSVAITEIRDVEHFMGCFFPEGFDTDQDTFAMKIRAMHGCALCIFEQEKRHSVLSQKGLCKLLHVLNFIRILMQALQQHEHLCWQLYNASLLMYTVCRYLMTMNCSAQALEYLLWTSISLELSVTLMTAKYLTWIVTLYCAVCHCYYDNQAAVQAELAAMIFKRAAFEARRRPKLMFRVKRKSALKDIPNWLRCLFTLCEVADARDLATVDCIMTVEMIHTLAILLETAAERSHPSPGACEAACEGVKPSSPPLLESSNTELLQRVCEVVDRGLEALAKGVATLLPENCSAIIDSAFMQRFDRLPPSAPSSFPPTSSEGNREEEKCQKKKEEVETKTESDTRASGHTQPSHVFLRATDLHLQLVIIHHRASLKLLQLNAESDLLDRIKNNKVSKALFLMQKASQAFNAEPRTRNETERLLEEAFTLTEKAGVEERKLYISSTPEPPSENRDKGKKEKEDNPPPPPLLLSRTDRSLSFSPAPYNLEGQVCWYQLCGRTAEGINLKVRLGDCSLQGTGTMVPAASGECVLRVEGLEPNQKYVFAVAAYDFQGNLLGNAIGGSTFPLLASLPVPLLYTWAHLAQVAFQTEQYAVAKRACRKLWMHYTYTDPGSLAMQDRLATTGLHVRTLHSSSPPQCRLFLTSIFIETEINIQQRSLYCDSLSDNGPFVWEQEARLAECEHMLVAVDLANWLNDGSAAVQAVVICYGLLAPLIFHQIACLPVVQVLQKCLIVLEENSSILKEEWIENTSKSFMHMIACITYYLSKASRVLRQHQMASVVMGSGSRLLQELYDAELRSGRVNTKAVGSKKDQAAIKGEMKTRLQLRALDYENKKAIASEAALIDDNAIPCPLTGGEDASVLYELISNSTLNDAYPKVMKLRNKVYFIEFSALILQRAVEEGHPDLVLKWGQNMFDLLCRFIFLDNEQLRFADDDALASFESDLAKCNELRESTT
ncbi:Cilia- and flagella-associated protein 54 [Liparis tanakae]|uniref:Cilia-and flagella-associated protein 54 n=1 Tax=Liparis tanakae TaxID=230148 RepID=A0A4Z2HFC2_9TELE|nr:Cilia- and flagella-associated protein 54 [Liparis tanakae]